MTGASKNTFGVLRFVQILIGEICLMRPGSNGEWMKESAICDNLLSRGTVSYLSERTYISNDYFSGGLVFGRGTSAHLCPDQPAGSRLSGHV